MRVRESNFFRWQDWLKLTLGSLSIVLAPVMTAPGWSAERIQVSYGIIQRSLSGTQLTQIKTSVPALSEPD
ncbi:MAG: hypothetical protein HC879_12340 [Leptolyngbyaceae cyanobacterium SL_5_9]|nr:hypothetical protein [Leptolyngbyaceae cyanobacterium SL_5_9]NJO72339.1 hypothetical protein [Leptolyngbyaceae cyanobacterium RM1_406_9]